MSDRPRGAIGRLISTFCREDMIDLLGHRPFANRKDAMDKWLDENRSRERSAPPPLEAPGEPTPAPAASPLPEQPRL